MADTSSGGSFLDRIGLNVADILGFGESMETADAERRANLLDKHLRHMGGAIQDGLVDAESIRESMKMIKKGKGGESFGNIILMAKSVSLDAKPLVWLNLIVALAKDPKTAQIIQNESIVQKVSEMRRSLRGQDYSADDQLKFFRKGVERDLAALFDTASTGESERKAA